MKNLMPAMSTTAADVPAAKTAAVTASIQTTAMTSVRVRTAVVTVMMMAGMTTRLDTRINRPAGSNKRTRVTRISMLLLALVVAKACDQKQRNTEDNYHENQNHCEYFDHRSSQSTRADDASQFIYPIL